jgi:hypothetical protein
LRRAQVSFLLELRTTAAASPNVLRRKLLRDAADRIQQAIGLLALGATAEGMQELNGAWAFGQRQLFLAEGDRPPRGGGGRVKVAA